MTKDEALKLALEALEEPLSPTKRMKAITAIKEVLAQPEEQRSCDKQEPVAVVDANDDGYWAEILPDRNVNVGQLLYTAPPQEQRSCDRRTWVGLTDEERLEAAEIDGADEWFWKVCKAIEAKLKQKNGYAEEKNK